ncbi:hypothetical protein ACH5RR_008934 [Cinchona calisaya]|uniref:Uncharacterized protein n=1 Tax=Cinchona calisaya TaxID=153742 RepID=A0ABD3AFR9_9GENT
MAHDIPTGGGNTLLERITHQEQALSQLMDRLGDLLVGYILMNDLREIKAISTVLKKHMRTVDATLDSLMYDLVVTKKAVASVLLDDFDLILGKEFMATNKIFPIPHLDGVMFTDERCPSFIPSGFVKTEFSAGPSSSGDRGKWGLDEFTDIMPAGLPKILPPQCVDNHHIGPVPGAILSTKAPCCMELVK